MSLDSLYSVCQERWCKVTICILYTHDHNHHFITQIGHEDKKMSLIGQKNGQISEKAWLIWLKTGVT